MNVSYAPLHGEGTWDSQVIKPGEAIIFENKESHSVCSRIQRGTWPWNPIKGSQLLWTPQACDTFMHSGRHTQKAPCLAQCSTISVFEILNTFYTWALHSHLHWARQSAYLVQWNRAPRISSARWDFYFQSTWHSCVACGGADFIISRLVSSPRPGSPRLRGNVTSWDVRDQLLRPEGSSSPLVFTGSARQPALAWKIDWLLEGNLLSLLPGMELGRD